MTYKSDFLDVLHQRGFIHQCSDLDGLDRLLQEGTQTGYIGFDATAPSLHAGSLIQIMTLYWFQQTGHRPISLMGGGTSKVGDPSFRDDARKLLDEATIRQNIAGIRNVFSRFLTYGDGPTDALMVDNDEWLADLNYLHFLRDYGTHFTINRMLTFDSVKLRLEREAPLTFLEFNYMIMQAYDFLELYRRYGARLQFGGSDQWGNIINGVELGRRVAGAELYALTTPLLTTASGAKMGKSASGAVWLNATLLPPYDYYQYWRNTADADVGRFLKLYTTLPLAEIAKLEARQGREINEAKKVLAFEVTRLCHGESAAREAAGTAQTVFEQHGVGEALPAVRMEQALLSKGVPLVDLLIQAGLAASKSEARRLVKGGGARCNDQLVTDESMRIDESNLTPEGVIKLSAGKKRHALVRVT